MNIFEETIGGYSFVKSAECFSVAFEGRSLLTLSGSFLCGLKTEMKPRQTAGALKLNRRVKSVSPMDGDYCAATDKKRVSLSGTFTDADMSDWSLGFTPTEKGLEFSFKTRGFDEVRFSFASEKEESFYGFGEQFTFLDMSGKAFPLVVSEQGVGRGAQPLSTLVNLVIPDAAGDDYTTYAPMPVFITSLGRAAAFLKNTIYHFDVKKKKKNTVSVDVYGNVFSGVLFSAKTPLELIEKHTAVTGRLRPLPDFAYDAVLGIRGGRKVAEEVLDKCIAHGAPVKSVWIEDWQGRRGKNGGPPLWWRWFPDENLYPDFKNWARDLKKRGIALMGYANPSLSAHEDNPLYLEAVEKGYLLKDENGDNYENSFFTGKEYKYSLVDLSNPEAYEWLKGKMKTGMIDSGLSGWMADYGEYLPLNGKPKSGDAVSAHCELPLLWARLNSELIDETGNRGKILTFHRSAAVGSDAYATAYWAGDQNPTFDKHDGLASSVNALITSGISGMSVNHTDIGGFTTLMTPIFKLVRKKEVMLRWLEYAAFTPVFRTHDGNYSNPLNYQFYYDEEGYEFYAKTARTHSALKWYYLLLQKDAAERGLPMVRALFLHYPNYSVCKRINRQYLLGEDLLVNPVWKAGAKTVKAYLPEGEWIHPYSGREYKGGAFYELPAPIGQPAVLVRKKSGQVERLVESIREILK